MPGNGLALAVLISGQEEFVSVRKLLLQLGDFGLLVVVDHVESGVAVVDVDTKARPSLTLVLSRDIGGPLGQVADVPHRSFDVIPWAEIALDGLGFGRRLDNDETTPRGGGLVRGLRGQRVSFSHDQLAPPKRRHA